MRPQGGVAIRDTLQNVLVPTFLRRTAACAARLETVVARAQARCEETSAGEMPFFGRLGPRVDPHLESGRRVQLQPLAG